MKLTPNPQRVIIKLKNNFNDTIKSSTGVDFQIDVTYETTVHVRIEGEVVGVPNRIKSNPLTQEYVGVPSPSFGANAPILNLYHATPNWLYPEDLVFDVIVGDKIYFHYNSIDFLDNYVETNRDSWLGTDEDGYEYHQISIDNIYCRIRDGKLKMLNGRVLVTQTNEEKKEVTLADGNTVSAVLSESGLITSLGDKAKYLEGTLNYIGEYVFEDLSVKQGDKVMFLKNSEFKNKIEGVEYYVMAQWDIVAKWDGYKYVPVGKYVQIEIVNDDKYIIPTQSLLRQKVGIITKKASECLNNCSLGTVVSFSPLSKRLVEVEKDIIFVREEDIFYQFL